MNISSLIEGSPELLSKLEGLGLSQTNISSIADEVGAQLTGGDGLDFGDILSALGTDDFLSQLNVDAIAEKALISPELAQKAVGFMGPFVDNFGGEQKGLLGRLAGGLFGKKN